MPRQSKFSLIHAVQDDAALLPTLSAAPTAPPIGQPVLELVVQVLMQKLDLHVSSSKVSTKTTDHLLVFHAFRALSVT